MATEAERVTAVQAESERLKQYLSALPQEAWTKPSACARWEVRDVVAHLIRAAPAYTTHITRGRRGDTSPPANRPDPGLFKTHSPAERQQWVAGLAQRPIEDRERVGNDLLPLFSQAWGQFHQLLTSLSAQDWYTPCYHSFGIIPVRALASVGVFELTIHGWDIRSALEPSAHLSPDALAVVLDHCAECLHWFFLPGTRLSLPLRYRVALTGACSGQWDIVVEGDTAHMAPAVEALPANVTFSCDGETFALLMCGRIGFDAALGDKRVISTGDMASVQAFKKWFQGV